MKFDSFDEAKILDNMLLEMAAYDVTHGLVPIISSKEAHHDLYNQVFRRFNQFKRGIQLGEYTFESIRDDVLSRNGPYPQKHVSDEQMIDDLINPKPKQERMTESQAKDAIIAMEEMIKILRRNTLRDADGIFDEPEPPDMEKND